MLAAILVIDQKVALQYFPSTPLLLRLFAKPYKNTISVRRFNEIHLKGFENKRPKPTISVLHGNVLGTIFNC